MVDLRDMGPDRAQAMTGHNVSGRNGPTIAGAMTGVALIAAVLASITGADPTINTVFFLWITVLLPMRLIQGLQRPMSTATAAAAVLTLVYLAWGALLHFRPFYLRGDWLILDAIHGIYRYVGQRVLDRRPPPYPHISIETMRWNWGLLAIFYAAVLFLALSGRLFTRRSTVRGDRSTTRRARGGPSAGLRWIRAITGIMALFFVSGWSQGIAPLADRSMPGAPWARPLCLTGLAGSLLLAAIAMRPWPAPRRAWRSVARGARLLPAITAGIITGLVWSLWGWEGSARIAALFVAMILLFARRPARRRRGLILALLLAMFWGFAISAEIVQNPDGLAFTARARRSGFRIVADPRIRPIASRANGWEDPNGSIRLTSCSPTRAPSSYPTPARPITMRRARPQPTRSPATTGASPWKRTSPIS